MNHNVNPRSARRSSAGLGLIEILVTVVIIAVLALVLIPRVTGGKDPVSGQTVAAPRERAEQVVGVSHLQQINMAVQMYRQDNDNQNPPDLAALKSYGVTDEMIRDPITHQPLAYNPQTGIVGGGSAGAGNNASSPALPRVPGY